MKEQTTQQEKKPTFKKSYRYIYAWILFSAMGFILFKLTVQNPVTEKNSDPVNDPVPQSIVATEPSTVDRADSIPIVGSEDEQLAPVIYESEDPVANVLIVRGVLTVFSLGMNQVGRELQDLGYTVSVVPAIQAHKEALRIRNQMARNDSDIPLIIMGHSLGGDLAPKMAAVFGEKDIQVDLLIMLDSTMPTAPPKNVARCLNLYQTNRTPDWAPVFRGSEIQAKAKETELINVNIRELAGRNQTQGINHFNIDSSPWIHKLLVKAIQSGVSEETSEDLKKSFEEIAKETPPSSVKSANRNNEPRRLWPRRGKSRNLRR